MSSLDEFKDYKEIKNLKDEVMRLEDEKEELLEINAKEIKKLKMSKTKDYKKIIEDRNSNSQDADSQFDSERQMKKAFSEIYKLTGEKVKTIEDCVRLFRQMSNISINKNNKDIKNEDLNEDVMRNMTKYIENLEEEINELNETIQDSKKKEKDLRKKFVSKDEDIEDLKEEIDNIKKLGDKNMKHLELKVDQLTEALESKDDELCKIKKNKEFDIDRNTLTTQIETLADQDRMKATEIKKLKDNIEDIQNNQSKAKEALIENIERLKAEREKLKNDLKSSKETIERKQKALNSIIKKIEEHKNKNCELETVVNDIKLERDNLKKEVHTEKEKYEYLEILFNNSKEIINNLNDKVKNQENDLRRCKRDCLSATIPLDTLIEKKEADDKSLTNWWKKHQE